MSKKYFKRAAALVTAAMMVVGSMTTVMAEAGTSDGAGSYEGGKITYPTISVTLPTISEHTYDYIADPNGLIQIAEGHYTDAIFERSGQDAGIYFKNGKKGGEGDDKDCDVYTNKSNAVSLTNENAQDIDVTVELKQKTAGGAGIQYSTSATFEASDKVNKIYLAITDDAEENAKTAAVGGADAPAKITVTVPGTPDNFEAKYDNGYKYEKKGDATGWKSCSFVMTGALNKHATWGDNVTFPEITVTWTYEATPTDKAPDVATKTVAVTSGTAFDLTYDLGVGDLKATKITSMKFTGTGSKPVNNYELKDTAFVSGIADGKISFAAAFANEIINKYDTSKLDITFDDNESTTVTVTFTK